jgi:AraC-like DNA-binding protein
MESKEPVSDSKILVESYNPSHSISKPFAEARVCNMIIVETEPQTINLLKQEFEPTFKLYVVSDGLEAWKLAVDIIPNIVITKENPDNINGHDLCHKIKEDDRTCHIPVIMVAESSIEGHHDFAADDFLTKPLDINYLRQRVDYLVSQKERIKKQFEKKSILKPDEISSYDEKLLDKVVSYIESNLSNTNLSVEVMSKEIGISRVQLYRKIKSMMNQSPNEFIRNYRILKAGQLLEQKKLNISDVRITVGFKDADYFRSCFKKEFGVTPSEYINNSKNAA